MSDLSAISNYSLFSGVWNYQDLKYPDDGEKERVRAGYPFSKRALEEEETVAPIAESKGKKVRQEEREVAVFVLEGRRLRKKPEIREEGQLVDIIIPQLILTYASRSSSD